MSEEVDRYSSGKGESVTSIPKPDLVLFKVTGHLEKVMGQRVLAILDKATAANRKIFLFLDWAEMTGYDSEVRILLTQWAATNRNRVTFHVLVGSKIVSMGVSVANLALGGSIIGYTNRSTFEASLRSTRMGLHNVLRK